METLKACYGASNLKSMTINGKLTSVGDKAFGKTNKNLVIKVSGVTNKEFKATEKALRASGLPKTVKIRKVK